MPVSIDLPVNGKKHKLVLNGVLARKQLAKSKLSHQYRRWADADAEHQIYVTERQADTLRKNSQTKGEGFQYVDVHVPYSYAIMMSMHTYFCSVFLSRDPIMQYTGRHGESENNVMAIESLIDYQTTIGGHMPVHYVWLLDATKYGLGIIWQYWSKEEIGVAKYVDEPITRGGLDFGKTKNVKKTIKVSGYEGTRVFNVRPQDYLPDPRVPMHSPNKGEFQGRLFYLSSLNLHKGGMSKQYMNVDTVMHRAKSKSGEKMKDREETVTEHLPDPSSASTGYKDDTLLDDIPCIEMVIEIIPKLWNLGNGDMPEKWVFVVAYEEVVIEAHPYGMMHGKFPGETLEIEADGYNLGSRGILEIAKPLNDTMNWLFNSHFYNVRKSLNGDIVYDPSRISTRDIRDGGAGKRIRVKPEAYGEDIRKFMHVIPADAAVTQTHMRDMSVIQDMMNKVTGVAEQIMGNQSQGGRKSATEVRTASSSSINRMKTSAEYMSVMGFSPFAQQMLQTTQQMYDQEKKYKIAGDLIENAEKFMSVTPDMIAGDYDYVAVDGALPIDRYALVNMWGNFFSQMRNFPEIGKTYDMGRLFGYVAQLGGLKNVKQFRINMGQPDGNDGQLLPIGELMDGQSGQRGAPQLPGQGAGTANGAGDTPQPPGAGR
jgi:hypothetical protein